MDSGYYTGVIQDSIDDTGKVALIDPAKRSGSVPFCPAQKQRYKIRTTVERANAHPKNLCIRGRKKMDLVLGCAVVALAVTQMRFLLQERQKTA